MNIKVAAIILNYNSSEDCFKCIDFLKKQTWGNLAIYLVDNHSTDKEKKALEEYAEKNSAIKVIFQKSNQGFSAGNNAGLKAAVAEGAQWCLVINPDVELRDPNWLATMMNGIAEYPLAVVAGSNVLLPSGERQNPQRELKYWEELIWFSYILKSKLFGAKGYLTNDAQGYCDRLSGCCFLIKASFLEEIGFLDEHVFMYCEEPILAKQVVMHGYKEVYINTVTAYHQHFVSQKGNARNRMQFLFDSREYYLKHYSGYSNPALKLLLLSKKIQRQLWK